MRIKSRNFCTHMGGILQHNLVGKQSVEQDSYAQSVVAVCVNCLSAKGEQSVAVITVHALQSSDSFETVTHADPRASHRLVSAAHEGLS